MFRRRYYNYKFRFISSLIVGIILLINAGFVSYKQETLTCNLSENSCKVLRVNYFNQKKTVSLTKPYDISDVIVIKTQERYKKRGHNEYYTAYHVSFLDVNNNRMHVFATEYRDSDAAQNKVNQIKEKLLNHDNEIIVKRK